MFKAVVILALVAVATAAPQILFRSATPIINNEAAKQVGLPFANGWTDGPNNGLGPVVHAVAHAPVVHAAHTIAHAPVVSAYSHSPVVSAYSAPFLHHGAQWVL